MASVYANSISENEFDLRFWQTKGLAGKVSGGRGQAVRVPSTLGSVILRHYRRGGIVAKILSDQYLWTGLARTRPVCEWRLTRALYAQNLPVPEPIGVRIVRSGLIYRGDLMTREIPHCQTLADYLGEQPLSPAEWAQLGVTLQRFFNANVWHNDLNAHNILCQKNTENPQLSPLTFWVIDWDRGFFAPIDLNKKSEMLARLSRSLGKIASQRQKQNQKFFFDFTKSVKIITKLDF